MTPGQIEAMAKRWVDTWIERGGDVRDMEARGFLPVVRELAGVPFGPDVEAGIACAIVELAERRRPAAV